MITFAVDSCTDYGLFVSLLTLVGVLVLLFRR